MNRKEIIERLQTIEEDSRNGTPDGNRELLKRLQKTANQSKHSGYYPTITQIKMCINCIYRARGSFESGYCIYTDITGKENGIRTHGYCQVYEPDPRKADASLNKEIRATYIERPRQKTEPEQKKTKPKRRPR